MRRLLQLAAVAALLRACWAVAGAARGVTHALGAGPGALRSAALASPQSRAGHFANVEPGSTVDRRATAPLLLRRLVLRDRPGRPSGPVPLLPGVATEPAPNLAVTWFGHSSVLVEIDGRRVLSDPMWSDRASPSRSVGPRRLHPVPAPLERLPVPDAVLISHDHYDHLDCASVATLTAHTAASFVVPVGVGAHLRRWGVPQRRIVELDWEDSTQIGGLTLTCTRSRHFSGRGTARDPTQWASWAVVGPRHRVFVCGDTGFTDAFARAGAALGPFDLTLLPIGAYSDLWPDIHMTPEEAVRAHTDLRGELLVPVHWATFDLAFHRWAEPISRLVAAAAENNAVVAVPRPGERIDVENRTPVKDWWTRLG